MNAHDSQTLNSPTPRPNGVWAYQANIFDGLYTALVGLFITFKSFWRKPATVQYPDVDMTAQFVPNSNVVDDKKHVILNPVVADRFRGMLDVSLEICTGCDACAKVCPIDCIEVAGIKIEGHKGRKPYYFNIDMAKCMYCGLCVEPCPTDAIHFTREFEQVTPAIHDLFLRLISPEEGSRIKAQGEAEAEAKAKEKAAKAAAKKAAEAAEAKAEGGTEEKAPPKAEETPPKEEG